MEVFMLVEKKKGALSYILFSLLAGLTVLFVFGTLFISPILFTIAILFGVFAWLIKRSCTEYEYSYFDGDVRFTKIKNKSRRKKIGLYVMDETILIAPSGDRSVYNHENNNSYKVRDLTSGNKDAKVYIMVTKGENGMELIKFEPDEQILDAICRKYAQKVKK